MGQAVIFDLDEVLVWYASYGSNMCMARFLCYIEGGTPAGSNRHYKGCADQRPPRADMALELPYPLYFAGESKTWTGGMAFVGHEPGGDPTKARAYLITAAQFEQIVAQESRREHVPTIDFSTLRRKGRSTLLDGTGNYDKILYCGEQDGYPIVSLTSPHKYTSYSAPSAAYLSTISAGLQESHNMRPKDIAGYLSTKPGIAGNFTMAQLIQHAALCYTGR